MKTVTKTEAAKKDIEFTADFDEETNSYGVFGVTTGFCYSTWSDLDEAEKRARRMEADKSAYVGTK